jgi:hypothetical protein
VGARFRTVALALSILEKRNQGPTAVVIEYASHLCTVGAVLRAAGTSMWLDYGFPDGLLGITGFDGSEY